VWLGFLDRITGADFDVIGFLQRAVGYTLTGATGEQCVFIIHGPGANGKSVFLRTLRELAGEYGVDASIDTFLDRRNRESSNDLARLAGARFVCATELDEGKRLAEGLVKTLTGGEAIPARFMYQEYFEFTPIFKVWLAVNHKPSITGDDNGIWRRIRLVPFRVTIPQEEQDRELLNKIRTELPGILNWAIAGALAWREIGLSPPAAVAAATDAYRSESDAIGEWLLERCIKAAGSSIQAKLLYDDYAQFIDARGGKAFSMRRWAQRMADRGFEKDEGRLVHYRGVRLCDHCDLRGPVSPNFSIYTHAREVPESDLQRSQGRSDDDPDDVDYRSASRGE
jgi:putative DNA primase/helicase